MPLLQTPPKLLHLIPKISQHHQIRNIIRIIQTKNVCNLRLNKPNKTKPINSPTYTINPPRQRNSSQKIKRIINIKP